MTAKLSFFNSDSYVNILLYAVQSEYQLSQMDPRDALPHALVLYADMNAQCDEQSVDSRNICQAELRRSTCRVNIFQIQHLGKVPEGPLFLAIIEFLRKA